MDGEMANRQTDRELLDEVNIETRARNAKEKLSVTTFCYLTSSLLTFTAIGFSQALLKLEKTLPWGSRVPCGNTLL